MRKVPLPVRLVLRLLVLDDALLLDLVVVDRQWSQRAGDYSALQVLLGLGCLVGVLEADKSERVELTILLLLALLESHVLHHTKLVEQVNELLFGPQHWEALHVQVALALRRFVVDGLAQLLDKALRALERVPHHELVRQRAVGALSRARDRAAHLEAV